MSKQFAYIDPGGKFRRLKTNINDEKMLRACRKNILSIAEYESVYSWTGWTGGKLTPEISKTAIIDGIFIDFDDKDNPGRAIMDAAEIAQHVGHCTCNFSGSKGAHVMIHCRS